MKQDDPVETDAANSPIGRSATPRRSSDPVTAGLQQMFAAIADEPIPEDFLRLLDEIEASGKGVAQ